MTSLVSAHPQQLQQPLAQRQYPADTQLVNLDYLTDVERQLIMTVLDRDAALRQKEQTRIK